MTVEEIKQKIIDRLVYHEKMADYEKYMFDRECIRNEKHGQILEDKLILKLVFRMTTEELINEKRKRGYDKS